MAEGTFTWFDLMVDDVDKAIGFYSEVIGWKTMPFGGEVSDEAPPYMMFAVDDQPIGGVGKLSEEAKAMGAPNHWLGYVSTNNIAATVAKIGELGGKMLREPWTVAESVGQCAIAQDPQGAVFALFQAAGDHPGSPRGPGFMSWSELMTSDLQQARSFYSELCGWEESSTMDMGEAGPYWMFKTSDSGNTLGGMMNLQPSAPVPMWLYYVSVDKLDDALARVKNHGGQVVHGPIEVPGGEWVAQCMDNQGTAFALHSTSRQS